MGKHKDKVHESEPKGVFAAAYGYSQGGMASARSECDGCREMRAQVEADKIKGRAAAEAQRVARARKVRRRLVFGAWAAMGAAICLVLSIALAIVGTFSGYNFWESLWQSALVIYGIAALCVAAPAAGHYITVLVPKVSRWAAVRADEITKRKDR